jgi:hypothetical protein
MLGAVVERHLTKLDRLALAAKSAPGLTSPKRGEHAVGIRTRDRD